MVRHSSRIELSQSAMRSNLAFVRERVGPHPVISVVVKANAYGHGFEQAVRMGEACGVRHFSVASSQEAWEVLAARREDSRIMIMGILYDEDLPWVIEHDIEFFVFDLPRLARAAEVARAVGRPALVHLELETGGNRTGLSKDELPQAMSTIRSNSRQLRLEGLCTHLAGAETLANHFRVSRQIEQFRESCKRLRNRRFARVRCHVASSAAALGLPEHGMDMVRVGTAAYGLWPSPDIYNLHLKRVGKTSDPGALKRVLTWKTDVMHVKPVPKGEFVGYGTSYQAPRDMTVAVVPIGYGNGYPREMSNRGHVLVHGRQTPIVSAVNMNMFMLDVTPIRDIAVGDEVVLVGRQKRNAITLRSFSEFSHALNTEFVSRLPATIPRTVVR